MEKSKLFRRVKDKRILHHKIGFTTNVKGTYIVKKYKRRKKNLQNRPQTIKKMAIGTYISIITLNVNGLNAPTKRHRLVEWIFKRRELTTQSVDGDKNQYFYPIFTLGKPVLKFSSESLAFHTLRDPHCTSLLALNSRDKCRAWQPGSQEQVCRKGTEMHINEGNWKANKEFHS